MGDNGFDYEDMVDGEDSVELGTSTEVEVQTPAGEEVQPVKLSKGKVLFLLIAVIVGVILVLILVSEMGISRVDGTSGQNSNPQNTGNAASSAGIQNAGDTSHKNSDFSGVSGEVSSGASGDINYGVSGEVSGDSGKMSLIDGSIVDEKVRENEERAEFEYLSVEPNLGAEITVSGMVKSKLMYRVGDSYTYGVGLILVTGNGVNVECTYFCPKKTADALGVGDSLNVTYCCDSVGTVCVVSISR